MINVFYSHNRIIKETIDNIKSLLKAYVEKHLELFYPYWISIF